MAIRWKAPLLNGTKSLEGNCSHGNPDFCSWEGLRKYAQSQIVDGPIPGWKALRLEVKFGDVDPRYSDQRILLNPNDQDARLNEGDETWSRWCQMWPDGSIPGDAAWWGWYPKADELYDWPKIGHNGGSSVEFHHGPLNGDWNSLHPGSARLYFVCDQTGYRLEVVNPDTDGPSPSPGHPEAGVYNLADLVRGKWYDIKVHGKWSTDPAKGLLEVWVNGTKVLEFNNSTMYVATYSWFMIGLYRRLTIGDPSLKWDVGPKNGVTYPVGYTPQQGAPLYPRGDGEPQQTYVTGMVIGDTEADVDGAYAALDTSSVPAPTPAPAPQPTPSPTTGGTVATGTDPVTSQNVPPKALAGLQLLISLGPSLDQQISTINSKIGDLTAVRDALVTQRQAIQTLLDKGAWDKP